MWKRIDYTFRRGSTKMFECLRMKATLGGRKNNPKLGQYFIHVFYYTLYSFLKSFPLEIVELDASDRDPSMLLVGMPEVEICVFS